MKEKDNQAGEKGYRLVQNEGKITWRVEELWDGGVVRGPFGARDYAIKREEEIAKAEGFIDNLVLKEAIGAEISHKDAFEKDADGKWHCVAACSIEIENKEIVFKGGMSFTKGNPYMGVDVANWLEKNAS